MPLERQDSLHLQRR